MQRTVVMLIAVPDEQRVVDCIASRSGDLVDHQIAFTGSESGDGE